MGMTSPNPKTFLVRISCHKGEGPYYIAQMRLEYGVTQPSLALQLLNLELQHPCYSTPETLLSRELGICINSLRI